MPTTTLVKAIRKPLAWLVVLAAILLTMLALETSGSKHAPSLVPLSTVANTSAGNTNGHGNTSHCTDSHGQDGNKNPHCQMSHQ